MPPKKPAPTATPKSDRSAQHASPSYRSPTRPPTTAPAIVQRARQNPAFLTPQEVLQLQRTVGNRAVAQLMAGTSPSGGAVPRENRTGIPDTLKSGVESLSGFSLDDVMVHRDSTKPAQIGALAYTDGAAIHIAPGQEQHLPHEAWHVVQQRQGRVRPTLQLGNVPINDDTALEAEATAMGAKAAHTPPASPSDNPPPAQPPANRVTQGFFDGFPTASEVFRAAHAKGLSFPHIQILQWAATALQPFGKLAFYLENPDLIESQLYPLSPAYTQEVPVEEEKDQGFALPHKREVPETNKRPLKRIKLEESKPLSLPKVKGEPLLLTNEPVRGTLDLVEDAEEELQEFEIGLNEGDFSTHELAQLNDLLLKRKAPRDKERRRLLAEYVNAKVLEDEHKEYEHDEALFEYELKQEEYALRQEGFLEGSSEEDNLSDIEEPEFIEADFEEPYLRDSDEEPHSGTDTEGSDTEDEWDFETNEKRQTKTTSRLKREETLLKPHLVADRLKNIRAPDEQKRRTTMFGGEKKPRKGKEGEKTPKKKTRKPKEKEKYYRKESKFNHPNVTVGDRAKLPTKLTEQQIQDMAQLNILLSLNVPPATAAQLIDSKFVVAQYRGLFYSRSGFTHDTRAQHRQLDETDRPIFSASALTEGQFGLEGYYYLYNKPERREDLELYQQELLLQGQRIKQQLLSLRQQPVTEEVKNKAPRSTDRFKPRTMADVSTHFYSEDYEGYHNLMSEEQSSEKKEKKNPLAPLVTGLPNDSNPKVSTGDVPTHAARYAYGLKPYKGNEENILEPTYGAKGKPLHPYSGKMYVSVHPLSDYEEETGPSQLVPLQNEGRINIGQVIIPERESQFEGMVGEDRVKRQMKAKFPDFSKPYKPGHADRYGLTKTLFTAFKQALAETKTGTTERVFVEALLSNYLALHSELRAIEAAIEEAERQGATLVYRTGPRSFGFEPPAIITSKSKPKPQAKQPKPPTLSETLDLLVKKALSFQAKEESPSFRLSAPQNLRTQVTQQYAAITPIKGHDIACYIRSLVTAAATVHGVIQVNQIENIVSAIADHLANIQIRTRGQMVDAGGLVGAEVRRVLQQLAGGNFDPAVHVVMWDDSIGQITDFVVNQGTHHVWLFYTPGHFDLINRH